VLDHANTFGATSSTVAVTLPSRTDTMLMRSRRDRKDTPIGTSGGATGPSAVTTATAAPSGDAAKSTTSPWRIPRRADPSTATSTRRVDGAGGADP
jgi:hypothetical protein